MANYKIVVEGVSKHFKNTKVFSDISFNIKKGEIFCILGRSGCGKTTLLRMFSGLDTNYHGDILIN
ncbi:ABC-2 type transport system ATP-binding protein/iron(III) transport system ATP-binding protein/iron complex transport system ATP-binding protein [Flexibacter flexilis DSM 6793]|uniref:ABC-2 type transport system ATP-binding protein/iron(III) transport system ATP-binding protein/iron complex transport system ATP-binding protein n=1 Tax=Flexibacter flexilis DSM 6793 TaxID=927664 RepID=A0A1I1N979_9BACT|nr:ABC-2 type transport system ATP-binding protein/iron(III) transport system ATP-binding protein/iron complex transport system ATP-binding protein [Flexibacter flexilis DSM 6793]